MRCLRPVCLQRTGHFHAYPYLMCNTGERCPLIYTSNTTILAYTHLHPTPSDAFLTAAVLAAVAEGTSQLTGIANQVWLHTVQPGQLAWGSDHNEVIEATKIIRVQDQTLKRKSQQNKN